MRSFLRPCPPLLCCNDAVAAAMDVAAATVEAVATAMAGAVAFCKCREHLAFATHISHVTFCLRV
jgi:hypothetical protein